ncbi:hypothetical protein ACLKMH_17185 [Psychromonas sp. KJ10-10]|uniref:hypothetical protein n=1 Tax=Psychromonas sp. KJ10-10 TaxID=3391823 RepID=UPI0039B4D612
MILRARRCNGCDHILVDPDKKLRDAMNLKDALIFKCTDMNLEAQKNRFDKPQLCVTYQGENNESIKQIWQLSSQVQKRDFLKQFIQPHLIDRHREFTDSAPTKVVRNQHRLRHPEIVIAHKEGRFWKVREKLFDLHFYKETKR